jgi:hypothetical protein
MFCFVSRFTAVLLLVLAGTLAPAAAEERRPFNASDHGEVNSNFGGLLARKFQATHLGRSSLFVGVDLYTLQEYAVLIPSWGILTSASGDELRFYFDAAEYVVDSTGVLSAAVTFTGGTGRFQGATGSADVMFVFDTYFQHFAFRIDGSLGY